MSHPYRTNAAPPAEDEQKPYDSLGRTLETFERFLARELTYEQMHEELEFNRKMEGKR